MDGSIYGGVLDSVETMTEYEDTLELPVTARLAMGPEVIRQAWRLRYDAYALHNYISQDSSNVYSDKYDFHDGSKTVVVYRGRTPVSTVRTCFYSVGCREDYRDPIPVMETFPDEVESIVSDITARKGSARVAEVGRLARHPDFGSDEESIFALFRMVGYLLMHQRADAVISTVRKHHIGFYRRMGFRLVAGARTAKSLKLEHALMASIPNETQQLSDVLPVMRLLSEQDSNFPNFVSGREIPVFEPKQVDLDQGGIFARRFAGVHKPRMAPPAVVQAPRHEPAMSLAA